MTKQEEQIKDLQEQLKNSNAQNERIMKMVDQLKWFSNFESNVIHWAHEKNLLDPKNSFKQFTKMIEKSGEVASALFKDDREKLIDGLGDVLVTLIILAHQNTLTLETCSKMAWNEIKDRKGKTIDGKFIKQEDLK